MKYSASNIKSLLFFLFFLLVMYYFYLLNDLLDKFII